MRAAEVLGLTQPAVSKTIIELEEMLGVLLFERSRQNISLTSAGQIFLRYAGASLAALRQGLEAVDQAQSLHKSTVKVGALPTVSARLLPRVVEKYIQRYQGAKVRVVTGQTAVLHTQLRQGDLDIVIGRMSEPETMQGLSFNHLYSEEIAFLVRPNHPILLVERMDFSDIMHYPLVLPPTGSAIRPTVERFLLSQGIGMPSGQVETVSSTFGRSFTRNSDAIWIISEGVVIEDVSTGHLVRLPIETSETLGPVGLTVKTDTPLSIAAEIFVEVIREQINTERR
jgi:LysR family pca operon transcriptional activator